jgi:hypothetical protein
MIRSASISTAKATLIAVNQQPKGAHPRAPLIGNTYFDIHDLVIWVWLIGLWCGVRLGGAPAHGRVKVGEAHGCAVPTEADGTP